jgi:class 3 adenylate cyclase/predicted ATPase
MWYSLSKATCKQQVGPRSESQTLRVSAMARPTIDLAEWLGRHGLGQYVQTFAKNNIEYSVLPDLTEDDLKKLGISLGHRKKLLRAIEALTAAGQRTGTTTAVSNVTEVSPTSGQHREAEFRQITVMFCDLVGSTQLAQKLDPEDLQKLLDAYRRECSTAIRRYGGEVARYLGDGVMAFFGWPYAHEDDAPRAVHAALEIVSGVTKISGPVTLACRVGISSGPVLVSETTRSTASWSMDAVGETPNIAARLQTLAAIDTVLISESTRRLVSAVFDLQNLGLQELKGVAEAVYVYRVLAAKNAGSRFEAAHSGPLAPLIGRSSELSLLLDRWKKIKEGDGQVILLSGIPGVGKSRLLHELKSHIQHEPHILLHHQCSPYHSQSAFFPVIEQIEKAAQLSAREADADKIAKLKAYLPRLTNNSVEPVLLIANLLSVSTENHELSEFTPQQIKNRTISTVVDTLLAFSLQRPTLCIFEDAHWVDPSTLELLDLIISRIGRARVLLIVSCRPEFRPPWIGHANITVHSLTRLSKTEVRTLIRDLVQGRSISEELVDQIIEKADGVPLFIEELTSSMFSAPLRTQASSHRTAQPALLRVPETLSDALMERLDRVAPSRKVVQIAAVIGREFSYDVLAAASRLNEEEMVSVLSQLEQADIIYRIGISPSVRFAFKHALLRDAIYDSLLRSKRQQVHSDIATILKNDYPELVENQPEILAHHYQEAGNHQLAIRCWFESGQRALAHSANVEAIANFRNALQLLNALPETSERTKQELDIQLALGIPLIAVQGYAPAETREAFSQARALCLRLGNIPEYFQALFGLWGHSWMGGKNDDALQMADEFLSQSRALSDPVLPMVAHRVMGSTLLTIGDFQSSANHFEEAIRLSLSKGKQPLYNLYMVEPQAASLLLLSWDLWFLGYPDQSLSRVSEALALAQDIGHPYTIAFAHYMTSVVHLLRGEADRAFESAEKSFEMSQEQRFSLYVTLSRISRGRALGDLGRFGEARAEIVLGIDEARRRGIGFMRPMMDSWLAEMHAKAGENERALSIVEGALADIGDVTGRSWETELHRQRAQIILALNPSKSREAESYLTKSIEVARGQSAKSLELRAATSLAELWRTQGRLDEARALLEPIYGWFLEGAETADLRRARDVQSAVH